MKTYPLTEVSKFRQMFNLLGLIGLFWVATSLWSQAFAQVNGNDLLAPYRDFKPPEDLATRVMEGLLGANYTSPLTAGLTSNTLFGAVFLVFNVIVFAVGTVWASYGVTAGIVQTAHEGTVLGKRMSAIWMPVRMVTGIGGLVPAFSGFSLSQVVMILATSWGISFGNYAYNQALTFASSSATLTSAGFSRADPKSDGAAMAQALFRQRLCQREFENKNNLNIQAMGSPLPDSDVVKAFPLSRVVNGTSVVGRAVGTERNPSGCFGVGLKRKTYIGADQGGRWSSSLGFRSGAVNYQAINDQVWTGFAGNFASFAQNVDRIADTYYTQMAARGDVEVPLPVDEIRAAGIAFSGNVLANPVQGTLIKQDALQSMSKYGFFSAGSFYSTFAEANAAVIQASDATDFIVINPPEGSASLSSGDYDFISNSAKNAAGSAGKDPSKNYFCTGDGNNATGNCSYGQKIIGHLLDASTAGAGGSSLVLDPILALKNIGDYMMTFGESILVVSLLPQSMNAVASATSGVIAAGASLLGPAGAPVAGAAGSAAMTTGIAAALGGMAPYLGGLMFAVGALCAIYIPMVPFINWVSALTQYCCIAVEAVAAGPLWAFAHLQAEGEGMGQRTEKGYLYLLNLLFRPILMVVGFFAASALCILLGSVVAQMYLPTIAGAQGNSVTGIFSIIGYVFLFFLMMNIMIQALFHLVMELADDVIGWVGGIGRSNIGRDTESKAHNVFMAGGRFGAGGVDRAKAMTNLGGGPGGGSTPRDGPKKPKTE